MRLAVVALLAWALTAPVPADQNPSSPKFLAAVAKGDEALRAREYQDALDAYRDANNAAGRRSPRALLGMARAYEALGSFRSAADACLDGLKYAGDDAAVKSDLHHQRGLALARLAGATANVQLLTTAEVEFRAALARPDPPAIVWYHLGVTLLKQRRDADGIAALTTFVDRRNGMPEVEEARRMIENPRRARVLYAPEFSVVTLSGQRLSLKDLSGKTLLLDFWGTWCAPCREATPQLLKLYRKYGQPSADGTAAPFEMIGISSDEPKNEGALRKYIEETGMRWPQIHDVGRPLQRLFGVVPYPSYIVIDAEGIIRERIEGWNAATSIQQIDAALRNAMREPAPR